MAGAGSILGNEVLRLEDPTLLTGEGKYVDDLVETGMLHVALVRSPVAHGTINSVDLGDAESMPGVVAVYHAGNDLGMPSMQGFPMLPPDYNRPIFASDRVRFVGDVIAAVVAESQAQANDAAEQVFADIDALPVVMTAAAGLAADAPLLVPRHRLERVLRHRVRQGGRRPVRGCRRRRRGHDGQSASRRCPDGEQRRRLHSRGRRAHDVGVAPGAAHDPRRVRADARPRTRAAAHRVPVGGRRVRSEGRRVHRAPHRRQGRAHARQAREVGREPLGGHGVAGPRPRLRHDRPAGRQQRRQDRRPRLRGAGLRGRLPGDRRHPADVDADDVGRCLRGPEGALRRQDGAHEQHHHRRLSRCRPTRGHPADRTGPRRCRRPDRHRPGRDPPRQLHAARHVPAHHHHRRELRLG